MQRHILQPGGGAFHTDRALVEESLRAGAVRIVEQAWVSLYQRDADHAMHFGAVNESNYFVRRFAK